MSGFAGFVRPPDTVTDNPNPSSLSAAIQSAAARAGVPASVIDLIWGVEAGRAADPYQEVGYNEAGYGGFFGLPSSYLGTAQEQADTAASLISRFYQQTGSYVAAVNIYNTGKPDQGYGSQYADLLSSVTTATPSSTTQQGGNACPPGQVLLNGVCGYIGRGGFIPADSPAAKPVPATRPGSGGATVPGTGDVTGANGRGAADVGAFFNEVMSKARDTVAGAAAAVVILVIVVALVLLGAFRATEG